jgi:hypothetical protein
MATDVPLNDAALGDADCPGLPLEEAQLPACRCSC